MNHEVRELSEDGKTVRITTWDERWYMKTLEDGSMKEYPSTTWITGYCPMGVGYYKWLAQLGWDEAQSVLERSGAVGYKTHKGIELLNLGNDIGINDTLPNRDGVQEIITLDEYEGLMSYREWFKEVNPKIILGEETVFNDEYMYAGTADLLCEINGELTLIDFKTSKDVYPSHRAQVAAYEKCLEKKYNIQARGILQLNYKKNKHKKWKYTELGDDFHLFLAAKEFWSDECKDKVIFQRDYPTSLSLSLS